PKDERDHECPRSLNSDTLTQRVWSNQNGHLRARGRQVCAAVPPIPPDPEARSIPSCCDCRSEPAAHPRSADSNSPLDPRAGCCCPKIPHLSAPAPPP